MNPGFRFRQIRERLGLTYRDVERASVSLSRLYARPQFTVHISRLADIENAGVVPSLHKLYALAVIYHLNPMEISSWYEIPLDRSLRDAVSFSTPRTHLMGCADSIPDPEQIAPQFFPDSTELLARSAAANSGAIDNLLRNQSGHHRYGYIGLRDRRMEPILRPGSLVLVDVSVRRLQVSSWSNEYDRPTYLLNCMKDTAAVGFSRKAPGWPCNRIHFRGACRNPGGLRTMPRLWAGSSGWSPGCPFP